MPRVTRAAGKSKVRFAREQRRRMTAAESALWQAIRGGKLGMKFRRQHPIGDFVLDFYCESAQLAVEIDGDCHEQQREYDEWRDQELAKLGVRVIRVPSDQIITDLPSSLALITPYPTDQLEVIQVSQVSRPETV